MDSYYKVVRAFAVMVAAVVGICDLNLIAWAWTRESWERYLYALSSHWTTECRDYITRGFLICGLGYSRSDGRSCGVLPRPRVWTSLALESRRDLQCIARRCWSPASHLGLLFCRTRPLASLHRTQLYLYIIETRLCRGLRIIGECNRRNQLATYWTIQVI